MRTAEQIDAYIVRKHEDGSVAGNIASGLSLPVSYVHARMRALGLDCGPSDHTPVYKVHPMWSADGHELRTAIWQRQRDGASATLRGRP